MLPKFNILGFYWFLDCLQTVQTSGPIYSLAGRWAGGGRENFAHKNVVKTRGNAAKIPNYSVFFVL